MADLRVTSGVQPPVPSPQQSEAVRAAQRAFFQAALNGVAPTAPTRVVEAQPTALAPRAAPATSTPPAEPTRYMRPGSLLDIKV